MKFAINGALTIGTLDGANIEIKDSVGQDNIFIFGMTAQEVLDLKKSSYKPYEYYLKNPQLKRCIDQLRDGVFSPDQPALFKPIVDSLLGQDPYCVLADYASYVACQRKVSATYANSESWTRSSILNVANMGVFSSDRSIEDYCKIWNIKPVHIEDFKVT
jgi:starch phosphorylase